MSTGSFENWAGNISEIGPIYPFVGTEFLWFVLCVAFWIYWHIAQARLENEAYEKAMQKHGSPEALRRIINREDPENP